MLNCILNVLSVGSDVSNPRLAVYLLLMLCIIDELILQNATDALPR